VVIVFTALCKKENMRAVSHQASTLPDFPFFAVGSCDHFGGILIAYDLFFLGGPFNDALGLCRDIDHMANVLQSSQYSHCVLPNNPVQ